MFELRVVSLFEVESINLYGTDVTAARQVEIANAENERLLLNILPASIAERLGRGEEPIADAFDEMAVLFAMSSTLPRSQPRIRRGRSSRYRRRHRPQEVHLRRLGRHGEHRQPHGVERRSGCIQVTHETARRLSDRYAFERRGIIDVKGKREVETYFLKSRLPDPANLGRAE